MDIKFIFFVNCFLVLHSFVQTFTTASILMPELNCSPGQYATIENDKYICKQYLKLGDSCSISSNNYCSPVLHCQPETNTCVYSWRFNAQINCNVGDYDCPTYKSCPKDSILIKANNETNCCDLCQSKSKLGDYCDSKQVCVGGLRCTDNFCSPSEKCDVVRCAQVKPNDCAPGTYFVSQDGIEHCCDYCQKYLSLGDECDDYNNKFCNNPLACQQHYTEPNRCVYRWEQVFEINCKQSICPEIESCPNNYVLHRADSKYQCCDSCDRKSKLGEYCDSKVLCYGKLKCVDHTCTDSEKCSLVRCQQVQECSDPNYYLSLRNGDDECCNRCIKFSQLDESCDLVRRCAPGLICDRRSNTCINGHIVPL